MKTLSLAYSWLVICVHRKKKLSRPKEFLIINNYPSWIEVFSWAARNPVKRARETLHPPKTWLVGFLLATDTGGDDLTVDRWRWLQNASRIEGLRFHQYLRIRFLPTLRSSDLNGTLYPSIFLLHLCSLYLSHMNLYLAGLQISLDPLFFLTPATLGGHLGWYISPISTAEPHPMWNQTAGIY